MKKLLLAFLAGVPLLGNAQFLTEDFEGSWSPVPAATGTSTQWLTLDNGIGTAFNWVQAGHTATTPSFEGVEGTHAAYLERENVMDGTFAEDCLVTPEFVMPDNGAMTFQSRLTLPQDQGGIYRVLLIPAGFDPLDLGNFVEIEEWTETQLNPDQTAYEEITVNFGTAYAGSTVRVAFMMAGDNADRWLIDNISIEETCAPPSQVAISNIGLTTATINWTQNGTATEWIVEAVPAGTAPSGNGIVTTTNPFTLDVPGLSTTGFDVYVTAVCPDGGVSNIAGPCFFPPTMMNTLTGTVRYDANGNGTCDDDNWEAAGSMEMLLSIEGQPAYTLYTSSEGHYALYGLPVGTYDVSLQVVPTAAFPEIDPVVQEVVFSNEFSESTIFVCLPEPEPVSDLSVMLVAQTAAQPGFPATYSAVVTNQGSLPATNVVLSVSFDDDRLDFESASEPGSASGEMITFSLGTIAPFSTVNKQIIFGVLPPDVNMGGETLTFEAALAQAETDITPEDNTATLEHIIVNSYDPNDIRVHEGPFITEEQADDYLTYTIRFQNTGTASAVNVRLENDLDELLDWDTFQPLASSHEFTTMRSGNHLEFRFDNIFLPDETADEPGSHGYVTYQIKPKAGLEIGEVIYNSAGIYFDFNPVILTNVATTQIEPPAGVPNHQNAVAVLYPNPVIDKLEVTNVSGEVINIRVSDVNGRECMVRNGSDSIDMQELGDGIYFVRVETTVGSQVFKVLKN